MAEVFVSYSRANRDRINGLSDALETSGYSVWWDRSLTAGADYAMVIEEQIDAAPCVVVAWSQTARQSLWVRAEANEALDAGKLVQINLDNARLPLPFTMLHFLDFSGWSGTREEECWSSLDSRVKRRLRGEWVDDKPPPPPPALAGLGKVSLLGWASILVAALVAVAVALVATGSLSAAAFGGLTLAALAVAALLLALTAFSLARIAMASRR
jgi:hypothetical protein